MRTLVLAPVSLVFFLLIANLGPAVAGEAALISGCLTNGGGLVKLSLGDAPNRPCNSRQVQLSFGIMGLNDASRERPPLRRPGFPVDGIRDGAAVVLRLHFPF
ncbi:MAG: hypothetical protein IID55_11880 [Proteobacteria bacterium]|nr:hypothetical protein [Pseudomonadota bacterium]